jgi:hypothetical protein
MSRQQIWMDPTAPEKKCSWHNPQHAGWPIHGSVPRFSPKPTNEAVDLSQASVDGKLIGLPGPYHHDAIGTFNTCLRGPTHRSLTNTGAGYSFRGADFSHTTLWPFQPVVSPFHLRALPDLRLSIQPLPIDLEKNQTLNLTSGSLHLTSTVIYHLSIAWAIDIPPRDMLNKGNPEGSS